MARKTYKYASNEVSNFKIFSSPEGPGRGPTCLDSIKTRGYTVKKLTLFFKKLKICAGLRGIRKSALGFHKEQLKFERTKKNSNKSNMMTYCKIYSMAPHCKYCYYLVGHTFPAYCQIFNMAPYCKYCYYLVGHMFPAPYCKIYSMTPYCKRG